MAQRTFSNWREKVLEYSERDEEILNAIIQRGYLSSEDSNIGVSESFALDVLIQEKKVVRNIGDKNSAICDKTGEYNPGILTKILVLAPDKESLKAMEKYWQKEMIARNYRFQVTNRVKLMQAFEFQMSAVNNYYAPFEIQISGKDCIERYLSDLEEKDISVTNRSSICFVIEEGKYKVLFLGDAVIYNNGSLMKRLEEKYGRTCHFTAIKLPHHGSRYNVLKIIYDICIRSQRLANYEVTEKGAQLWAITLSWLCSLNDIKIRDNASKGLANLFQKNTNIIIAVLNKPELFTAV